MEKCKCYHTQMRYHFDTGVEEPVGYCYGTKECEECSCGGDKLKCNFYDYIRRQAENDRAMRIQTTLKRLRNEELSLLENQYLSRQEAIDAIIARAQILNKKVPEKLLERLFK